MCRASGQQVNGTFAGVSQLGSHRAFDEACIHWLRRHVLPPCFGIEGPSRKLFPSRGSELCVHQMLTSRNCSFHMGPGLWILKAQRWLQCRGGASGSSQGVAPICPVGCDFPSVHGDLDTQQMAISRVVEGGKALSKKFARAEAQKSIINQADCRLGTEGFRSSRVRWETNFDCKCLRQNRPQGCPENDDSVVLCGNVLVPVWCSAFDGWSARCARSSQQCKKKLWRKQ